MLLLLNSLRAISLDDSSAENLMLQLKQTYCTLYHFSTRTFQVYACLCHFDFQREREREIERERDRKKNRRKEGRKGRKEGKKEKKERTKLNDVRTKEEKELKLTWFVKGKACGG